MFDYLIAGAISLLETLFGSLSCMGCDTLPNGLRISRRRDARGATAGKARLKSQNHDRQNPTDGKCTLPRISTQAPGYLERGRVDGRLHARVGQRQAGNTPITTALRGTASINL